MPMPFIQALLAMDIRPIPLAGPPSVKVVDEGIQRTLEAIAARDGDVMLGSHDADFLPHLSALLDAGRQVAVLGFREFVERGLRRTSPAPGLEIFDLEADVRCFDRPCPGCGSSRWTSSTRRSSCSRAQTRRTRRRGRTGGFDAGGSVE